jgi:dynein heavy chain
MRTPVGVLSACKSSSHAVESALAKHQHTLGFVQVVLDSLLGLQPAVSASTGGTSKEGRVSAIAADLLEQVPPPFNLEQVMKAKADDPSALHVVLFQEIERYNMLLVRAQKSCAELIKGIQGLVVMSADLDLIFEALLNGKVPPLWLKTYPSLKPLGSWMRDLLLRIDQLARWVEDTYPTVYWLSGFTYPTCFLTAVLQTTARKNSIPIDTLSFEYGILNLEPSEVNTPPREGVYVQGVFLEGAGWDFEEVQRFFLHCLALVAAVVVGVPAVGSACKQGRDLLEVEPK